MPGNQRGDEKARLKGALPRNNPSSTGAIPEKKGFATRGEGGKRRESSSKGGPEGAQRRGGHFSGAKRGGAGQVHLRVKESKETLAELP